MKKAFLGTTALALVILVACNSKENKTENTSDTPATQAYAPKDAPANQPKSYTVTLSPDSALLGKSMEALVKLSGGTAIALTDPDGKDNGIELVLKLQVSNRNTIETGGSISVSYADSRLQLDNGNNIAAETGTDYLRAQPEATSTIESWTYKIPAGAKPSALNLFLDGTRSSVNVSLK